MKTCDESFNHFMTQKKRGSHIRIRLLEQQLAMSQLLESWIGFILWYQLPSVFLHHNNWLIDLGLPVHCYFKEHYGGFSFIGRWGFQDKRQSWISSPHRVLTHKYRNVLSLNIGRNVFFLWIERGKIYIFL